MCNWTEIKIEPRDVLFFRGAKPMSASAIGEGANWPMPAVFHQALLSAFHAKWPEIQDEWEHRHHTGNDKNAQSSFRFGGLKTIGVFPERDGTLYFPMPADVQCANDEGMLCILHPGELTGRGDLPTPLKKGLFKKGDATKQKPKSWISCADLMNYLHGTVAQNDEKWEPLFDVESRPGIELDADTETTLERQFYISETLRLRDGVALKGLATCEQVRYQDEREPIDVLSRFFAEPQSDAFIFGGQRGVAFLDGVRDSKTTKKLLAPAAPAGCRIKWVTLTPSMFMGGWLPSWIDAAHGTICASEITKPSRKPGESRAAWRARFEKKTIPGKLVAACIPKPLAYSGWRDHGGSGKTGARPTRLCVPAGAVYYFDVDGENSEALIEFLNGKCKSDMAAEKGFGFGLCGVWNERKEGE